MGQWGQCTYGTNGQFGSKATRRPKSLVLAPYPNCAPQAPQGKAFYLCMYGKCRYVGHVQLACTWRRFECMHKCVYDA